MAPITPYTGSDLTALTTQLLAAGSGITIGTGSIVLKASGQNAVNYYDGSSNLGIGAGLLLTSGYAPGLQNTVGWDGQDNSGMTGFYNGDADIDAVVNTVFQTQSYDATTLEFDFRATDLNATSISFDIVFGSEEYPEWVDAFVDCAVVIVNGVNYALFNHDPNAPLSVISPNLAAGYFQDNAGNVLAIQYDGVSQVLKIVAPINGNGATNHIKIGIADTGDHILDSGIFIANLSAGNIPGSGVVTPTTVCDDSSNSVTGSAQAEYFDLKGGDDIAYAGAGDDIVVAGSGNDVVYGGSGADEMEGDAGDDSLDGGTSLDVNGNVQNDTAVYAGAWANGQGNYTFADLGGSYTISSTSEGTDTLTNVEFAKFSDGLFTLGPSGLTQVTDPVTPPSNAPGLVFLTGIGGQGQTLTAKVSDTDGVPAAGITYAWQANGVDLGVSGNTFVVGGEQVGQNITVTASYTDLAGNAEALTSASKTISAPGNGDFKITLLNLSAPIGASVMNPLTTLVKNAIDLGVSPNEAGIIIKSALGIDPAMNLLHYDSWAALQTNPADAAALAVEKTAVQVAVMTSLGGDETGMALTQAILLAHSNNTTLDLTNEAVILDVLGQVPAVPLDPNDPVNMLVHEIWDRNDTIGSAADVAEIEGIWADLQSGQSFVLSNSIGTLSVHINQAPTGTATAGLAIGVEGAAYTVSAVDLLQGFSDAEGDALSVSGLAADKGTVTYNGGGTFTITFAANYTGPVELTYNVIDNMGGSAPASQMFVIEATPTTPTNTAPELTGTMATLAAGTEDSAYTVSAAALLAGFSDIDSADVLSVSSLIASNGTAAQNSDGSWTITPSANFNGAVTLSYNVTDSNGGNVGGTQSYSLAAVNDAPTGTTTATLANGTEDTAYIVSAANLLAGFSDVDSAAMLSVSSLSASNGTAAQNSDSSWTITPTANFNGAVTLTYNVTDSNGGNVGGTQSYSLAAVNDAHTGTVSIIGTAQQGQTLTASNTIADVDGLGSLQYQWFASGANIAGVTGSTLALTADHVGKAITVTASYTDFHGIFESETSIATAAVGAPAALNLVGTSGADTLTGDAGNDTLSGLAGIDKLYGLAGNDVLNGGAGVDVLDGGEGSDLYLVTLSTEHSKAEFKDSGSVGVDEVRFAATAASTLNLYSGDTGIERVVIGTGTAASAITSGTTALNVNASAVTKALVIVGNAGINSLTGTGLNDTLDGGAGADKLVGGSGNDVLVGGDGKDTLTGGAGSDSFVFNTAANASTNLDTITDFVHLTDKLQFSTTVFSGLDPTWTAEQFWTAAGATSAHDATDRLVYNSTTGALYYDADGSGSVAAIKVALVGTSKSHPAMDWTDIQIMG